MYSILQIELIFCLYTQSSLYLLVCCEDGSMMEVSAPNLGKYDTSKTYHLDELKFTSRKFTSIKDRLRVSRRREGGGRREGGREMWREREVEGKRERERERG